MSIDNALERLKECAQATLGTAGGQVNLANARVAIHKAIAIIERNRPDDTATLRDQLAMTAVQAMLSASDKHFQTFDQLAERAYCFADSMLKARQQ